MNEHRNESLRRTSSPLQRALWCGVVFSLSVVISIMNLYPIEIRYQVDAQVVTSPQRLKRLSDESQTLPANEEVDADTSSPRLSMVKVLDDRTLDPSVPHASKGEPLALLAVQSIWTGRTSTPKVRLWLKELSDEGPIKSYGRSSTSEARFARWQIQATEHYLKRLSAQEESATTKVVQTTESSSDDLISLASNSQSTPTRLATLTQSQSESGADTEAIEESSGEIKKDSTELSNPESLGTTEKTDTVELRAKLETELAVARELAESEDSKVQSAQSQNAGTIAISGSPTVRPLPASIPTSTILSVIVLALAAAVLGGWSHYRAESGGVYAPQEVAKELELEGLPVSGTISVRFANHQSDWLEQTAGHADAFRRVCMRKLVFASEFLLMFWCTALVVRAALDPLWRMLLIDNPLAALSRLVIGLP